MAKIKKDIIGLYVKSGGYIARPVDNHTGVPFETAFKEGDFVIAYHHGGTTMHSIKKLTVKERWSCVNSMEGYVYDFAKKYFYSTQPEFDSFLLKFYSSRRSDEICKMINEIRDAERNSTRDATSLYL